MASAQTEPSMDEILASIRRIISEEDDAPQEVPVRQKLETLQLGGEQGAEASGEPEPEEKPKPRARAKKAEPAPEPEEAAEEPAAAEAETADEPEAEGGSDHVSEAGAQDEASDELDDFEPLPEEPVAASSTMEPAAEAHDHGETTDDTFDAAPETEAAAPRPTASQPTASEAPAVQAIQEAATAAVRPAVAAAVNGAVSDRAADQARGAFGALEENMRLSSGSGRTIEDLVEAMLTPLLSAWLDENLPRIVEDKVEEEVRRISRRR